MRKSTWGIIALFLCCTTGYCTDAVPKHKWTFKFEAPKRVYAMGLEKKSPREAVLLDRRFVTDAALPADFDLSSVTQLSPILDQGQCGSCVYHSVTSNFADSWLLRGKDFGGKNFMSVESLMTSPLDQGGKCGGAYFMSTAPATQQGLALGSDCPYAMGRRGCGSAQKYGPIQSVRLIDPSPKSIMTALTQKYPVSNTIGANGNFQGYQGGVFNACANVGTNHETLIIGYSCETAKDASGNCQLDASGKLPPGVGYWKVRNSWGTGWGEQGFYRIKMTDARGRLCNNVAEEVGIIETGVTPPAPTPAPSPSPFSGLPWQALLDILHWVISLFSAAVVVGFLRRK